MSVPRNVLPSEDVVFRLDHKLGWRQAFPMTFNNVGLGDDGFEFNGVSSWITTPVKNIDFPVSPFSFESIFQIPDTTQNQVLCNFNMSTSKVFGIRIGAGSIRCGIYNGSTYSKKASGNIASSENDYHVVVTFDGTTLALYINGVLQTGTIEPSLATPAGYVIGTNMDKNANFFAGCMKTSSLYKRALTATEAMDRYLEKTFLVE